MTWRVELSNLPRLLPSPRGPEVASNHLGDAGTVTPPLSGVTHPSTLPGASHAGIGRTAIPLGCATGGRVSVPPDAAATLCTGVRPGGCRRPAEVGRLCGPCHDRMLDDRDEIGEDF